MAGPLLAAAYWLIGWGYYQFVAPLDSMVDYGQYEGELGAWPARPLIRLKDQPPAVRGKLSWHYSKSKIVVDLIWIEWTEALRCDTAGRGTFTHVTSRPSPHRVYDYRARDWQLTDPWPAETAEAITVEHVRRAGGALPCCMRSTVRFSPWPLATRHLTLNAECNFSNIFWFEE